MIDPWQDGLPYDMLDAFGGDFSVSPIDVYRDIFRLRPDAEADGKGEIQSSGKYGGLKANPIVYYKKHVSDKHGHFRVILEDTFDDDYDMLCDAEFVIMNGLTYFGRRNLQDAASKMYALIFDIDGVDSKRVRNLLHQASNGICPVPNYLVFSGGGIHLYYIFEKPIALFPYTKIQLKSLKYALTRILWNPHTSHLEHPQYQGINQGFRLIGGLTKKGYSIKRSFPVRFRKEFYSIAELNQYVPKEIQVDETKLFKESKYTLDEAKKKFPKWYDRVILNKESMSTEKDKRRKWRIEEKVHGSNPYALYDWWLDKISKGASFGHRYFCVMMLAIYAVKCNVPQERLEKDAFALIPKMNALNPDEKFTKDDVKSALECFDDRYATFPIRDIEKLSAISINMNLRKGRSQYEHMALMRSNAITLRKMGSTKNWGKDGRPSAEQKVLEWKKAHPTGKQKECEVELRLSHSTVSKWWGKERSYDIIVKWRAAHPYGKKLDCIRETGLSKPTVYKWWNYNLDSTDDCRGISPSDIVSAVFEYGALTYNGYNRNSLKNLPEHYVISDDPMMAQNLLELKQKGINQVYLLTSEEYKYLSKMSEFKKAFESCTFSVNILTKEVLNFMTDFQWVPKLSLNDELNIEPLLTLIKSHPEYVTEDFFKTFGI